MMLRILRTAFERIADEAEGGDPMDFIFATVMLLFASAVPLLIIGALFLTGISMLQGGGCQ